MIFVDTNAWVALANTSDKFHKDAAAWIKMSKKEKFVTSNLVVIETLGWLRYSKGRNLAVEVGRNLYLGSDIDIERVLSSDEEKAWKVFQEIDGRGISMIDCTTFVLMRRLKIKDIFTFDEDFKKLGFIVYPDLL